MNSYVFLCIQSLDGPTTIFVNLPQTHRLCMSEVVKQWRIRWSCSQNNVFLRLLVLVGWTDHRQTLAEWNVLHCNNEDVSHKNNMNKYVSLHIQIWKPYLSLWGSRDGLWTDKQPTRSTDKLCMTETCCTGITRKLLMKTRLAHAASYVFLRVLGQTACRSLWPRALETLHCCCMLINCCCAAAMMKRRSLQPNTQKYLTNTFSGDARNWQRCWG